jgi:hypothetical protein
MKPTKTHSPEYATFSSALQKVLQVSHAELKSQLEVEKKRKKRKPKKASASRDSAV